MTPATPDPILSEFLLETDRFCAAHGLSRAWLSTRLFGRHSRLDDFRCGSVSPTTATLARARATMREIARRLPDNAA